MNPLKWIRWKAVTVLAVIGAAVYFLGFSQALLARLNAAGRTSGTARFSAGGLALGFLSGEMRLEQLLVAPAPKGAGKPREPGVAREAGPPEESERAFSAERVVVDISTLELLSRRLVVDRVALLRPLAEIVRRPDGTANVGDLGEGPPEEEAPPEALPEGAKRPIDWLGTVQRWYERIQRARKWVPEKRRAPRGKAPWSVDYSRAAEYPFQGRPSVEIREIIGEGLRIAFVDKGRGETLAEIEDGVLKISNVTSSPSSQKEPTSFELSGKLADSKVSIRGIVDFREGRSRIALDADLPGLPASLVGAFVGASLPVKLSSGKVGVHAKLALDGLDSMDVQPTLLFDGVLLEAKDPSGKIAGFEAERFVKAFNEASSEIGSFAIEDLRISGPFFAPKFEWGASVKELVLSGAKAFARRQVDRGLEKAKERVGGLIEKLEIPGPAGSEVKRKLEETVKGTPSEAIEKLLPGVLGGKRTAEKERK